jgi:hypothetical protein
VNSTSMTPPKARAANAAIVVVSSKASSWVVPQSIAGKAVLEVDDDAVEKGRPVLVLPGAGEVDGTVEVVKAADGVGSPSSRAATAVFIMILLIPPYPYCPFAILSFRISAITTRIRDRGFVIPGRDRGRVHRCD